MKIIEKAREFIKKNQIDIVGQNPKQIIINVGNKIVILKRKAGRVLDSCSCQNHSRFCNENPRCSHKIAAITFITMKGVKW